MESRTSGVSPMPACGEIQRGRHQQNGEDNVENFSAFVSTGIAGVDGNYGYLKSSYNFLSVSDSKVGLVAVGHFLNAAIQQGERVSLVGFDKQAHVTKQLRSYGFDFERAFAKERVLFHYYKPSFSQTLGLALDYQRLFSSLMRLGHLSTRIGVLDANVLFDLQSDCLLKKSMEQLAVYTGQLQSTLLAAHVARDDTVCENASLLPSWTELRREPGQQESYLFSCRGGGGEICRLQLKEGVGLVR